VQLGMINRKNKYHKGRSSEEELLLFALVYLHVVCDFPGE